MASISGEQYTALSIVSPQTTPLMNIFSTWNDPIHTCWPTGWCWLYKPVVAPPVPVHSMIH